MIREAVVDDTPRLVEMGAAFFDLTPYRNVTVFDDRSFEASLHRYMASPDWSVRVLDHRGAAAGMAISVVYPLYFNESHRTGQEMVWWVEPERRGRGMELHFEMERWARGQGARSFSMGAVAGLRDDTLAEAYRHQGYQRSETMFLRGLR